MENISRVLIFTDFNFHGSHPTAKFCENWNKAMLKFPIIGYCIDVLTSKAPNTTIAEFASTVDPDETAHHLDLKCLPSNLIFFNIADVILLSAFLQLYGLTQCIFLTEYTMSSGSLLQLRSRRSRSSTPLVTNGDISGVTPQTVTTPQHNNDHHGADQYWTPVGATARQPADDHHRADQYSTPVGATARRPADASFKNDDKVSPMLAKLRMTPGMYMTIEKYLHIRTPINFAKPPPIWAWRN